MLVSLTGETTAVLTIANPPANTLSMAVLAELDSALDSIATNGRTRVLILTSASGPFASGGDINELLETVGDREAIAEHVELTGSLFRRLSNLPIPVIAAVDGAAVGGGLELLLCCDIVVATAAARFGVPEVKLGLIPGAGGTQRLARRIGELRAADLLLTGRLVDAARAYDIGLITEVVEGSALDQAHAIADRIAAYSSDAVRSAKGALRQGLDQTLDEGLSVERELFVNLMMQRDSVSGLRAFLNRAKG